MFRAPALVALVAVSLVAVRSGHLCGVLGTTGRQPATCHHTGGHSDAATSVADPRNMGDCGAARQSIAGCAEVDSAQRGMRLESGCGVRQVSEAGLPRDTGAALAPAVHRLSLLLAVCIPRRAVGERIPLERRPLRTNLRI
jgi:hypothetical protein